jgi:uncharacterized protein (TIGR00730 family)
MTHTPSFAALETLRADLNQLLDQLPTLPEGELILQSLTSLFQISQTEMDRLDWKILRSCLRDLKRGFQVFADYRHTRKIAIFGSSRLPDDSPAYKLAIDFAQCVTAQGFMVMTGGGGGIMEAANKGAGTDQSFGLNIELPFEQSANPYIEGSNKLINFKYFFTRKLFFLRETDAIALFPGGFGTQDEAFECLTLTQTGKSPPVPLVLIDAPGGSYWQDWDKYVCKHLRDTGLISPEDNRLYTITDDLGVACSTIAEFYRVYHSSRYVDERLVIRLNQELSDSDVEQLNQKFADILLTGKISKSKALPAELGRDAATSSPEQSAIDQLPRLVLHFNQLDHGRLYQLIATINQMGIPTPATAHPERK